MLSIDTQDPDGERPGEGAVGEEGRGKDLPSPGIDANRDAAMTEAVVETSTPTDLSPD